MLSGNDHGNIHAGKVCLYTAILAGKLGISDKDTLVLMAAAVFHDIGRVNNSDDPSHGDESAEKLNNLDSDFWKSVEEVIRLHSRSDKKLSTSRYAELVKIFKDSDALDRVRTGDLDERYLRFDESKSLVKLAKEIHICLSTAIE